MWSLLVCILAFLTFQTRGVYTTCAVSKANVKRQYNPSNDYYNANPDDNQNYWNNPGCATSESYEVKLIELDGHLYLLFTPHSVKSGCPTFLFDSRSMPDNSATVGLFRSLSADVKATLDDEPTLYLARRALGKIVRAVMTHSDNEPGAYDVVANNCANKILEVLNELDISVTTEVRTFTHNTLVNEPNVISLLRANENLRFLFPTETTDQIQAKSDSELITAVIDKTISRVNSGAAIFLHPLVVLMSISLFL